MPNDETAQHNPLENPPQQAEQEAQREWVEPTFQRLTLKDAMNSSPNINASDGLLYYS